MANDQEGLAASVAVELEKISKALTTSGRTRIAEKNFALPGGRYPIHDAAHARNALSRVAQHGTPAEQAQVRAAVARKYPGIGKEKKAFVGALSGAALGYGLGNLLGAAAHMDGVESVAKLRAKALKNRSRLDKLLLHDPEERAIGEIERGVDRAARALPVAGAGTGAILGQYLTGRIARNKQDGKEKKAFLQGDPKAMQVAQQRMVEIWVRLMILYMLYWDGHWKSAGPMQNADHALFARLYGDTVKPIDEISEKIHGYFGNQGFSLPQAMGMVIQGLQELYSSGEDHVQMGLLAEDYFQAHLRQTHQELTQLGVLPLGLDDWLMATASDFETHGYLLQQRAAAMPFAQKTKTASLWSSLFGKPARAATATEASSQLLKNMNLPKRSPEDTLKLLKAQRQAGLPLNLNANLPRNSQGR